MEFLYCFANASLTQRILDYLLRQMMASVESVTTIFLSDRWVLHIKLHSETDPEQGDNCWAFLNENGVPYYPNTIVALALHDLDAGCPPTQVMNRYHVSIVSHGRPQPEEVDCFQAKFVAGLGYCPQSLG